MNLYFDTEFTGLHQYTTLISIGIISDNNQYFYAELTDYDSSQLNDWLNENVIDKLLYNKINRNKLFLLEDRTDVVGDSKFVAYHLERWLEQFEEVEMWSDCLAYDWTLFNQLFNGQLPNMIYYIPFDICTLFKIKGIEPDINRENFASVKGNRKKHNALYDALIIKQCYEILMDR